MTSQRVELPHFLRCVLHRQVRVQHIIGTELISVFQSLQAVGDHCSLLSTCDSTKGWFPILAQRDPFSPTGQKPGLRASSAKYKSKVCKFSVCCCFPLCCTYVIMSVSSPGSPRTPSTNSGVLVKANLLHCRPSSKLNLGKTESSRYSHEALLPPLKQNYQRHSTCNKSSRLGAHQGTRHSEAKLINSTRKRDSTSSQPLPSRPPLPADKLICPCLTNSNTRAPCEGISHALTNGVPPS